MSITRKSAQKLAKKLIDNTFSGMSQSVTFENTTGGSYNTQTGEINSTTETRVYTGILGPFNNQKFEVQDFVQGDAQFVVVASKLDIEINNQTKVIGPDGTNYRLVNRLEDAAGAALTLQLRQKRKG